MKKLHLLSLLLCVIRLSAQTDLPNAFPNNHFLVYTTADGLPSNIIHAITTDKDGFMWIATTNGLARYDGQRFTPFRDLVVHSDLPEKQIQYVFVDSHGSLWLRYASQETYHIDLRTYKVTQLKENFWRQHENYYPRSLEDKAGNVWFNVLDGVVKWDYLVKKYTFYPFTNDSTQKVLRICKGGDNYFWAATRKGIYRFDMQKNIFEIEHNLLSHLEKTRAIETDDAGKLWISNWYNHQEGLIWYDPQQQQIIKIFNKQATSPFANTDMWDIHAAEGRVWFAANFGGIAAFDPAQNRFQNYKPDPANPFSIQSEMIFFIHTDKAGNTWLGTPNGLHCLPKQLKKPTLLKYVPNNPNSLASSKATAAFNLDERTVILGTLFGVSIYDRIDKTFKNINLPVFNGNNYNNNINTITSGENGSFWVGTWSGLFRLDKATGRTLEYFITFNNAGQNHPESVKRMDVGAIWYIRRDKKGVLWIVNDHMHLVKMDEKSHPRVFEMIDTLLRDNDPKKSLLSCFIDYTDRYMLLATDNGLVQFDNNDNSYHELPIVFQNENGAVKITDLSWSKTGLLLAIANGKPFKIDLEKRTGTLIVPQIIKHNFIKIIEDTEGGVWLSTENDLVRTNLSGQSAAFFDSKNYLSDNTFQLAGNHSIDKDNAGNLYFGGSKGFTVITPQEMLHNADAPSVKIATLKFNNQPIDLEEVIHLQKAIALPYSQNNFTLEFAAMGSTIPELNRFAYRLNGNDWVDLGTQNKVNFSHLESGTYQLQVKAANSDGVWNEEGVKLLITIRPPWYRSWLAWLVYLSALGYGVFYYYQYQLRRKLAFAEIKRLKDLDDYKSRFFANITHELRTPLSVILAPLSTVLKSGTLDNRNFTLVRLIRQNAEGLLKLVNEILDLNKLEAGKLELHEEPVVVYNLIRRLVANFESHAQQQNIRFNFNYQPDKYLQLALDTHKIEKIINNLLSNALKFTPKEGIITVSVTDLQNQLLITVNDTGRGIHPVDLPQVFNRFYQSPQSDATSNMGSGIGLSLASELAKLMDGSLTVESTLGEGSTFSFSFPKKEILGTVASKEAIEMNDELRIRNGELGIRNGEEIVLDKHNATILIVEDNASLRDYLSLILQAKFNVVLAENGQAALNQLKIKNDELGIRNGEWGIPNSSFLIPNLILSDVMMPIMDGFEFLSALKSDDNLCTIPVIMLTARAELQDKLKALRIGVDDYLVKPFEEEELFARIDNLLKNVVNRKTTFPPNPQRGSYEFPDEVEALSNETTEPTLSAQEMTWLSDLEVAVKKQLPDVTYSVEIMASDMAVSRAQLFRKLKALTGLSPQQYLQEARLYQALHLLETRQEQSVKATCYAVGLLQVTHFSQLFQQRFGKLPSAYLKN